MATLKHLGHFSNWCHSITATWHGMRGYSPRSPKLVVHGKFTRSDRISLLGFIGVGGLLETFITQGNVHAGQVL